MKTHCFKIVALLITLAFASAVAAGGEREVAGDVTALSANSISITVLGTKKTESFPLSIQTVILRGRSPISLSDIQIGEIALVHLKNVNGQEIATSIATKPRK